MAEIIISNLTTKTTLTINDITSVNDPSPLEANIYFKNNIEVMHTFIKNHFNNSAGGEYRISSIVGRPTSTSVGNVRILVCQKKSTLGAWQTLSDSPVALPCPPYCDLGHLLLV